jgi:hypothetical protein
MSRFFTLAPESGASVSISFQEFVELAKGVSIIDVVDTEGVLEFELSESLKLRLQPRGRLHVTIASVERSRGGFPVRVQLLGKGEEPSAALVEQRLHRLRQEYAINFLIDAGREGELSVGLSENPNTDLEELLAPGDRLYIQAATLGSLWITVLAKSVAARKTLRNMASLVYSEGREHLLRRIRAETELKELEVLAKDDAIRAQRVQTYLAILEKVEKLKNEATKEEARKVAQEQLKLLQSPSNLLPPPPD